MSSAQIVLNTCSAVQIPERIQRQDTVHLQEPVQIGRNSRLELKENDWTSIYIPQIADTLYLDNGKVPINEQVLSWLIQTNLELGQISRIDYVTRAGVGLAPPSKSALVHRPYGNNTLQFHNFRQRLKTKGPGK